MYIYKNKSKGILKFRAAAAADKPHIKKVYTCEAGKSISLSVKIDHEMMELTDEGEMRKSKKGKGE